MLRRVHPLAKLVACLVWIVALILIFDLRFQLVGLAAATLALVLLGRVRPIAALALMLPLALFGLGFLTTSLLFRQDGGYALRVAGEAAVSTDALSAGLVLFFRVLACGMVSALFVLTTDAGALVKTVMRDWRLPPRVGYALFSVLHIAPDLLAELRQIRLARAMARGAPPARVPGPVEAASLAVPLLAYAIRRATRASIAMEARGLGPDIRRTILDAQRFGRADLAFVVTAFALLAGALATITG